MFFNFKSLVAASIMFASAAFAQSSVVIGAPANGSTVTAGSNITVQLKHHRSLSSFVEVAVVIQAARQVLYNGPYNPEEHDGGDPGINLPYQNFTIAIPDNVPSGAVDFHIDHFYLLGAILDPQIEQLDLTLNVQ